MQPPSSPVTIQFSLWLHTIKRTARSCACPSNPETHMSIQVKDIYQMAIMDKNGTHKYWAEQAVPTIKHIRFVPAKSSQN